MDQPVLRLTLLPPRGETSAESAKFMTTRWTVVMAAGQEGPGRDAAMEQFAQAYWYPIYAFIRQRGTDPEAAADLTQEFFTQLLEKNWLSAVDRRGTRFSTLLLNILRNFLVDDHRRQTREKRGGGKQLLSLDLVFAEGWFGIEPNTAESPESIFERRLALAVLNSALERLGANLRSVGRGRQFDALSCFLSRDPEHGEYDTAATALGVSKGAVAAAVLRLRREYRSAVRDEVAAGLIDPRQVDEEMRHLSQALGT